MHLIVDLVVIPWSKVGVNAEWADIQSFVLPVLKAGRTNSADDCCHVLSLGFLHNRLTLYTQSFSKSLQNIEYSMDNAIDMIGSAIS